MNDANHCPHGWDLDERFCIECADETQLRDELKVSTGELEDLKELNADLLAALDDATNGLCDPCRASGNGGQTSCEASPSCIEREQMWFAAIAKARGPK